MVKKNRILTNNCQPESAANNIDKLAELEDFAATVAHDLQAPLRSLNMFTELLAQEYQHELDEKAQQYLNRITNSSSRMQILIEDLLAYSRAGTSQQTWIMVDLNQILHQVIEDLQPAIAKTGAEITVKDLPQILINPREIQQLCQNLMENAIKFSQPAPKIEVSATKQDQEWLFTITDNGIGIAPEFQLTIFQVFQQLHPVDVYSGTGIGLAICQKIVERYGGKIWVDSIVGEGSTFYFTLPINVCPQLENASIDKNI